MQALQGFFFSFPGSSCSLTELSSGVLPKAGNETAPDPGELAPLGPDGAAMFLIRKELTEAQPEVRSQPESPKNHPGTFSLYETK